METLKRPCGGLLQQYGIEDRAVSARDYEDLAMCASRDIQMVKCFAGYDDKGRPLSGAVTLVVLQKQFRQGQMQFTSLKETLLQYMRSRISTVLLDNHKFFIVQPRFIEIKVADGSERGKF